jgi:FkbM family methyltransferase
LTWKLDLREGIDLSIYLLGRFEPASVRCYSRIVKPGQVVLDVGANIGAHTLPLAQLVGDAGKVIAYEPTRFAFSKLQQNVCLNEAIAARVLPVQAMLVSASSVPLKPQLYSSWPLEPTQNVHSEHRGRLMDTSGAFAATLDAEMSRLAVERVAFVKLDVDGHECDVLEGAQATLTRDRPPILMELAPYVFSERAGDFDRMLRLIWALGYPTAGGFTALSSGRAYKER